MPQGWEVSGKLLHELEEIGKSLSDVGKIFSPHQMTKEETDRFIYL
jgi:hypothetical protein